MVKCSVMYPSSNDIKFDMNYYLDTHIPLLKRLVGDQLKSVSIDRAIVLPGPPPPYAVIANLVFDSLDILQASLAQHGPALMADIANYTNAQPVIQISEVL